MTTNEITHERIEQTSCKFPYHDNKQSATIRYHTSTTRANISELTLARSATLSGMIQPLHSLSVMIQCDYVT